MGVRWRRQRFQLHGGNKRTFANLSHELEKGLANMPHLLGFAADAGRIVLRTGCIPASSLEHPSSPEIDSVGFS